MSEPTHITDHATQAVEQMVSPMLDDDALVELVTILGGIVQDLEDAIWEVLTELELANAVGVQLDLWGRILGRTRQGLGDDAYRRLLAAWQGALRSQGRRAAIITALTAVAQPTRLQYRDLGMATYAVVLFVDGPPLDDGLREAILDIAEASAPSGVAYQIIEADDTTPFTFDTSGLGFDDGLLATRLA